MTNNEKMAVNQTETEPQKLACANACESSTKKMIMQMQMQM